MKKLLTYFVEPTNPDVISSRRVNALVCLIASIVFFALKFNVAAGAFLGAAFGNSALTLGGKK